MPPPPRGHRDGHDHVRAAQDPAVPDDGDPSHRSSDGGHISVSVLTCRKDERLDVEVLAVPESAQATTPAVPPEVGRVDREPSREPLQEPRHTRLAVPTEKPVTEDERRLRLPHSRANETDPVPSGHAERNSPIVEPMLERRERRERHVGKRTPNPRPSPGSPPLLRSPPSSTPERIQVARLVLLS